MSDLTKMTDLSKVESDSNSCGTSTTSVRVKTPKRILHFSDGTLEEYSSDDETDNVATNEKQIDVHRLHWGPWLFHTVSYGGNRFLAACDYVGESLADFFGITSPKYNYEIEHAKRIQEQRAKEREEEKNVGGWMQSTNETLVASGTNVADKNNEPATITNQENIQRY